MTYAKVVADSVYEDGPRLTTLEVRFHRFVLAEFNTHRVFSRNSASSRAIPVRKQLEKVRMDTALPVSWPAERKGMQGGDELGQDARLIARRRWARVRDRAVMEVSDLHTLGLHKSVTNRLLEPFMWHTVVVTSTSWTNFFQQRCSPLAQPEIRVAAEAMREAIDGSMPSSLVEGAWHLPYLQDEDFVALLELDEPQYGHAAQVSAARCARVSYETQDGRRDVLEDLALYQRLTTAQPAHWSPLEHVATPWPENRQRGHVGFFDAAGVPQHVAVNHLPKVGNLLGWRSLRTEVEAELEAVTYR